MLKEEKDIVVLRSENDMFLGQGFNVKVTFLMRWRKY
jgi:hypothetical protein